MAPLKGSQDTPGCCSTWLKTTGLGSDQSREGTKAGAVGGGRWEGTRVKDTSRSGVGSADSSPEQK